MRVILDTIYKSCGLVAGVFLVAILLLIVAQVISRLLLIPIAGADEFAAYCLTATTFFALAPTMRSGVHVRVSLLTQSLPSRAQRWVEIWAYGTGLLLSLYLTYACLDFVLTSSRMNTIANGMVAVPLWIPQLSMPIGAAVFSVSLLDGLITVIRGQTTKTS